MTTPKRTRISRSILALLLGSLALVALVPNLAAAACPRASTSNAFSRFGDDAAYTLAPGGSFESGTPGWGLSKAAVVAGNERFDLVPGTHSLAIEPRGGAVSPLVCTSSEYPTFRFVYHRLNGSSGSLNVSLRWVNVLGVSANTQVGELTTDGRWVPTPILEFGDTVPLWVPGTSLDVGLVFSSSGESTWAIDDVYIDPYSR
jgi:hypothetical protein